MESSASQPVALAPSDGPLLPRIRAALGAAGIAFVEEPQKDLDIAIVDASAPDAAASRAALGALAPRIAFLGIASLETPVDPDLLEVVSPEAIENELVSRLQHLRARLATFKEAQQRQRDLQVLLELTAAYADAADVDELFHGVTRRLADELKIDRVALLVVNADDAQGTIVAASDDPALKDLRLDLARYPEVREVLRTGKPVILEDAPSHPLLEDVKVTVAARGIRNIAALPLAVRGKVEGVLLLRRSAVGPFTGREIEFLTAVAQATAIAFRNITRLERIRLAREREKSARIAAEERASAFKRYQAYFDHLSDGVAILDARACIVSINPAGLRLLDVDDASAFGRHINALTNPSDDETLRDVLRSVAQGDVRTEVDLHVRTLAGRRLTLSLSAAPLEGGDVGEGVAVLTLRDVTRQRAIAEELRHTSEFLERLIDSSVDAIIASDMSGKVILFNKAAEAICQYAAADVIEKLHVNQLYPPGVPQELMRKLRSSEFGGKGRLTTSRVEILSRLGERIPVNMTASILYEQDVETATVGIFTDLRDRINLERRLTDAEARLLESEKNAVIVALAGTAAHELNQPLTSVMGYAELLKRKTAETEPSFRAVDIIHREAERMAEIVKKIGKITRFETQAYVGPLKIVDLEKAAPHDD